MKKKVTQDERVAKYLSVFNSAKGKWVLEDLTEKFTGHKGLGDGTADGITVAMLLAAQRGQSEVIDYIERQLNKGE